MKTSLHSLLKGAKKMCFIFFFLCVTSNSFSQIPLSFTGTPVVTGTPGTPGAKYTFLNVGTTGGQAINAEIIIVAVTGGAVLTNIDVASPGSNNAWQPVINGTQVSDNCWGIHFIINFFENPSDLPFVLNSFSFQCSGVDIDGDGGTLREYNTFYNANSYRVENPTALTATNNSGQYQFLSPQTEYPGIELTQTNVGVNCLYKKTTSIELELGSCCTGGDCSATGADRTHSINFFEPISFTNELLLPVKLISFNASKLSNGVLLGWKSAEELNLSKYILQYSADGTNFTDLAAINAKGSNAVYSYADNIVRGLPITYYRLKSVDIDGRFAFSSILVTREDKNSPADLTVSPNPFQKDFSITFRSAEKKEIDFRLINNEGRIVKSIHRQAAQGTNVFTMENNFNLPAGVYFVVAVSDKGIITKTKIVKQY